MSQTVLLDKDRHDRKRFDCGVDALNNFLGFSVTVLDVFCHSSSFQINPAPP